MADVRRDDGALALALRSVGERLDAPEVDVTAAVVRRLTAQGAAARRRVPRRIALVAAALLVLSLASAAVATLVVPGVELRFGDDPVEQPGSAAVDSDAGRDEPRAGPADATAPEEAGVGLEPALDLGDHVSPADATAALGQAPWLLAEHRAGQPELYLHPRSGVVSAAYPASPAMPELGGSGLGLVLSQFPSPDVPWFTKTLPGVTDVRAVRVDGHEGLWVEGPHELALLPDGSTRGRVREAANVLLWTVDGLTLRLESALDLETALELATALRHD